MSVKTDRLRLRLEQWELDLADVLDGMWGLVAERDDRPRPSELAARMAAIRPEIAEQWLREHDWEHDPQHSGSFGTGWFADSKKLAHRCGMLAHVLRDGALRGCGRDVGDVHDLWPHELLSEMEAMQARVDAPHA